MTQWLTRHIDYSLLYHMGESVEDNITYIAGLRATAIIDQIKPLKAIGVDRDYMYSNSSMKGRDKVSYQIRVLGSRVVVFGCEEDRLISNDSTLNICYNSTSLTVDVD
ncbi:hypothetical protein VNO77_22574 [Canavalia gladiata]|uniref:Uncharacterized protein n=1 Tax=Canavalia gladiata TaxID=3824 RepID=A0AAN9L311_CANGL